MNEVFDALLKVFDGHNKVFDVYIRCSKEY